MLYDIWLVFTFELLGNKGNVLRELICNDGVNGEKNEFAWGNIPFVA